MNERQATFERPVTVRTRAAYAKPVVKDFGYIGTLTQGGTIMMNEFSPGMNGPMRQFA